MSKQFVYDYYDVYVPNDVCETEQERADLVIDAAREQTKLYCVLCEWTSQHIPELDNCIDECYRVRRKRHYVPTERPHYHVLCSLQGGYMPDSNDYCESLGQAYNVAHNLKEQFLEDLDEDDKPMWFVYGDIRKDWLYRVESRTSSTHLGYVIEIIACSESDCEEE